MWVDGCCLCQNLWDRDEKLKICWGRRCRMRRGGLVKPGVFSEWYRCLLTLMYPEQEELGRFSLIILMCLRSHRSGTFGLHKSADCLGTAASQRQKSHAVAALKNCQLYFSVYSYVWCAHYRLVVFLIQFSQNSDWSTALQDLPAALSTCSDLLVERSNHF